MTPTQRGVAIGSGCAAVVAIVLIAYGLADAPGLPIGFVNPSLGQRLTLAVAAWLAPLATLAVSIGWVANIRGASAQDIDGAGLTIESPKIRIPRAVLTNSLEQVTLAIPVYAGLALTLAPRTLILPLMLSAAFAVGRILFAAGYRHGAAARSFGMALTMHPTVAGLIVLMWRLAAVGQG